MVPLTRSHLRTLSSTSSTNGGSTLPSGSTPQPTKPTRPPRVRPVQSRSTSSTSTTTNTATNATTTTAATSPTSPPSTPPPSAPPPSTPAKWPPGWNRFPYHLPFSHLDLRHHPSLYRPATGEQGVLLVRPYKDELLPHWSFKTPALARRSSTKLVHIFQIYKHERDFVGCDMARKFLQMGYTRSRRYANHRGGRKWKDPSDHSLGQIDRPAKEDPQKAESAAIFAAALERVKLDGEYPRLRDEFVQRYRDHAISQDEAVVATWKVKQREDVEVRSF